MLNKKKPESLELKNLNTLNKVFKDIPLEDEIIESLIWLCSWESSAVENIASAIQQVIAAEKLESQFPFIVYQWDKIAAQAIPLASFPSLADAKQFVVNKNKESYQVFHYIEAPEGQYTYGHVHKDIFRWFSPEEEATIYSTEIDAPVSIKEFKGEV